MNTNIDLRNKIGCIMIDDGPISDNLAIVLCTYFSCHKKRPEKDQDTENGWGEWVEKRCNETLDKIVGILKP